MCFKSASETTLKKSHPWLWFPEPCISHMEMTAFCCQKGVHWVRRLISLLQQTLQWTLLNLYLLALSHRCPIGSWFSKHKAFWLLQLQCHDKPSFFSSKYWLKCRSVFMHLVVDRLLLPGGCCSNVISILCIGFFYQLPVLFASAYDSPQGFLQHSWPDDDGFMFL